MIKIVNYLEKEFKFRREICILIIEPHIPEIINNRTYYRKPDALIIKDNVFCIIEMKGFHGEIIADCNRGAVWKSKDGQVLQPSDSQNPLDQARFYRLKLLSYLNENVSVRGYAPNWVKNDENSKWKWLEPYVHSWVVTEEESTPEIIGRKFPFFKVLPLDQLPQALTLLRSRPLLSSRKFKQLLSSFEAIKVTKSEWYRSEFQDNIEQPIELIPKITNWMEALDEKNRLKALEFIQELGLKQHRPHVIRSWEKSLHPEIRQEALLTLIEWQDEKLGYIFNEALQDESQQIVNFSLDYLEKNGYPETIKTLTDMLNTHQQDAYPKILKAITSSGHPDSCTIIYNFAKKTLFNKPFQRFQNYRQHYRQLSRKGAKKEKYIEFNALVKEERRILNLTTLLVGSLGELQCKESLSWLIDILTKPTSLGYESDDYKKLDSKTNYYYVFQAVCKALGKMGENDIYISSFLLDRLISSPEDFQYLIIELLGNIGEAAAVPLLLGYLKNQDDQLYDVTVTALSKIRSDESFDALAEAYISNPDSYSGAKTGEALWKLNQEWFVDLLLDQISLKHIKNDLKRVYLQALRGSVTLKCANTLFNLLKNKKLSNLAAWNLSYLINYDSVYERAMELTWSKNPIEKSSAMWVLEKHYTENPTELERFETEDASIEVRRTVAQLYLQSNSKHKLFKYAQDSDEDVRDSVFNYFWDKLMFGKHYFASDIRKSSLCKVGVDDEFLGISLKKEVSLISMEDIVEAAVTTHEDAFGLYLAIKEGEFVEERILLVPTQNYLDYGKRSVDNLKSKIKFNSFKHTRKINRKILVDLWKKVIDYRARAH